MSHLISCNSITKSYGAKPLFESISLTIKEGDRLGLIGPNGAGKSTLLKILAREEDTDSGEIIARKGLRVAYLPQSESFSNKTVEEVLSDAAPANLSEEERQRRVGQVRSVVGLQDLTVSSNTLSGGWQKRLAIATKLLLEPDLLLLDEPTNHLDLDGILWLERFIAGAPFAVVVISHDRMFLENCTTRTVEISRRYPQGFLTVDGNYSTFISRREDLLAQLQRQEQSLANSARRELEWLRRGPKARTTKASARIDRANELIDELQTTKARAKNQGTADVEFIATGRGTKRLIAFDKVSKGFQEKAVVNALSIEIQRGAKFGLLGANGSGKSTILKLMTGELAPDSGQIFRAPNLKVVIFDQQRRAVDSGDSLKKFLAPDSDSVVYNERLLHVASYARRFRFEHYQLETPVNQLSGGEKARLLVAKLMLQPADVLLLDEPTNDLDIDTVQVLEESLSEFTGAVVLITHDRLMMESVCETFLGIINGKAESFATFEQWQNARRVTERGVGDTEEPGSEPVANQVKKAVKLSYKEQRELGGIEKKIEEAEEQIQRWEAEIAALSAEGKPVTAACDELAKAHALLDQLFDRWQELESRRS